MNCPNCKADRFYEMSSTEDFACCLGCGWMVCRRCSGTGAIDAPYSGSDPSCESCSGEGSFDPSVWLTTEIKLGNPDRKASQ